MTLLRRLSNSISSLMIFLTGILAYAGGGSDHSHDPAGDWKTMAFVLGAVIAVGLALQFFNKKR